MPINHPEHASEQAYIERANALAQQARDAAADGAVAGADKFAMREIRRRALERLAQDIDPESVCFGRIDGGEHDMTLYVGRGAVHDGTHPLVINWQVRAAAPFYQANRSDPLGLTRRRRFQLDGTRLLGIVDEVFATPAPAGEVSAAPAESGAAIPSVDEHPVGQETTDAILADMERARAPEMRDIVATIAAAQYELISDAIDGVLAIQGGPGTGKTAIALHRAAWLLFNHREELDRAGVLVVGPNRAFMEYVSKVLPSLGEAAVVQVAIDRLVATDDVRVRATEPLEVERLKGDARMGDVLARAVRARIRIPGEPLALQVGATRVAVPAERISRLVDQALEAEASYLGGRTRFRRELVAVVGQLASEASRTVTRPSGEDIAAALRTNAAQRIWPAVSSTEIVRELLGNPELMVRASKGVLDDTERAMLRRDRRQDLREEPWTAGDMPLIDEVEHLLRGASSSYGYVIVDEAQDLTPMQLRMVFRRAPAARATLVGDLAQSTGSWRYRSWDALFEFLPGESENRVAELALSYRVPRQVMDLANELVPRIAPDVLVPRAVRPSAEDPRLVRVPAETMPQAMTDEVRARLDGERTLAVVVAAEAVGTSRAVLEDAGMTVGDVRVDGLSKQVTLLSAEAAKGLEFDHVVVVDPDSIVGDEQDWARLYVALTRPTRSLSVIHTSETPIPVEVVPLPPPAEPAPALASDVVVDAFEPLGPRFTEALMQAKFLHTHQRRRGTAVPYFAHLQAVCALVLEDGGSEDEAIAALLHDAAEDYGADVLDRIADQFGARVAEIVAECTDPDNDEDHSWRDVKREHIAGLEQAGPHARRVALAEKLDNARALLRDYRRLGPLLWQRMDVEPEDLLWYMAELADLFTAERPGDMASELQSTVEQLLDAATVA